MVVDPVYLHNPSFIELDDAYRSLSRLGEILLKTSNYEQAVYDLEKTGFVAIEILSHDSEDMGGSIRAFKGKHGPCHFIGHQARYSGGAFAALDDDNHLLFTDKLGDVCEKTFDIFSLAPYRKLIDCKKELPEAEQNKSIAEGEASDFESAQSFLLKKLENQHRSAENRKGLFYPGPFKLLILQDGTMVHRGKTNSIPLNCADKLIQTDGLRELKSEQKGMLSYFQDEYATYGSACLLGDFKFETSVQPDLETDFSSLNLISDSFKARLLKLIKDHKKYFVLIGNDADDQFGCCPSVEVTEANRLVKQGVLSALSEGMKGDSCPVTVYAFKGEIYVYDNVLVSHINEDFRTQIHEQIHGSRPRKRKGILKWMLLVFVAVSLIFATKKCNNLLYTSTENSLYEQLNPSKEKQIQLILFHNKKRCFQCLQIEQFTTEVLNDVFFDELAIERIQFKTLTIDDADNIPLVDHFGIFAATLVLMDFKQNELTKSKVLMEVTGLYRDELAFKAQLKNELEQFFTVPKYE